MKSTFTLITLSIIVIATLIYGFIDGGSPQAAKDRKFDEKRYSDIQSIQYAVKSYFNSHSALPLTLSEAVNSYQITSSTTDPKTKVPYEYIIVDRLTYKLCAVFATNTATGDLRAQSTISHTSGRYCYSFQVQN